MRSFKCWAIAALALSACGGNDKAPASSAKDITQFTIASVDGTITGASIALTLPAGTDVTSLTPTIAVSAGATVSPASGVAQDFTSPVDYTVTAADASTQRYTVTVTVAPASSAKDIAQFTIASVDGTITGTSITLTLPAATDVTNLTPTITVSAGAAVSPASGVAQDFTSPVVYTVTAADASTQQYTVTVTLAQQQQLLITSFVFSAADNAVLSADAVGVIGGSHIAVPVPNGTNVASLVPTIAVSGGTVSPASGAVQSFASPVTYTVTDGVSSKQYSVSVSATNKNIILFSIDGLDGTIVAGGGSGSGTVTLAMPCGTNLTSLAPLIGFTGTSVSPASGVAQDFSNSGTTPVLYTVTGADTTTKLFNVTVTAPCT